MIETKMTLEHENDLKQFTFTDDGGDKCKIIEEGGAIWLGCTYGSMMLLTREHVRALLPLLQHFAETGELPEVSP